MNRKDTKINNLTLQFSVRILFFFVKLGKLFTYLCAKKKLRLIVRLSELGSGQNKDYKLIFADYPLST